MLNLKCGGKRTTFLNDEKKNCNYNNIFGLVFNYGLILVRIHLAYASHVSLRLVESIHTWVYTNNLPQGSHFC